MRWVATGVGRWVGAGVVAVTAVGGLAGCASQGGVAPGGPATSTVIASPVSPVSPGPTPTESPSTLPEATDPGMVGTGTVTLSGVVRQGAEPGCLILHTSVFGMFELLNPRPVPRDGDHVHVTGQVADVMSHCMQGRPFVVKTLVIG